MNFRVDTPDYPRTLWEMYESGAPFNRGLSSFEYPLFRASDEELDYFLGSVAKGVSRGVSGIAKTAGRVAKTVGKGVNTVGKFIPMSTLTSTLARTPLGFAVRAGLGAVTAAASGKNVFQGDARALATDPAMRFMVDTAAGAARGENILKAAQKAAQAGIGDVRESLRFAAIVAPFVPGLGTGVAAALGAANALASGERITDALIAAARNAVPGGAIAQTAFDTAANLAKGKSLGDGALNAVRSRLPGGNAAQAAFDAGLALAKGKNIQDALIVGGARLLPKSPYAADVMSFVQKATSGGNLGKAALSATGNLVLNRIERQAGPAISSATRVPQFRLRKFQQEVAEVNENGSKAAVVPWDRHGFEYVKWLQQALNQVLKLKLSVDGKPGSHTMSAIQTLQRHSPNRLVRIGLVGEWTNRELVKGGAPAPPIFAPPAAVGIDCNFDARPYLPCIKKADRNGKQIAFVVRYYSGYPRKDLSRGEAEALSKLGIRCVTVWERFAKEATGYRNGTEHGHNAFRQAVQCGQPGGTPIYFAIDYEPSVAEHPGVERYFEGVRDGLKKGQGDPKLNPAGLHYEVGVYGNRVGLDLCKAQGIATWFWQSCSLLTADAANQFRWPGVSLHQVACEKPLCASCGSKRCQVKVDWNESDGHEGGWLVSGMAKPATEIAEELGTKGTPGTFTSRPSAGPAGSSNPAGAVAVIPSIILEKVRLTWDNAAPVAFSATGSGYRALFKQPLPGVGNVVVRLRGRLGAIDAKTGSTRSMTAAEIKNIGAKNARTQTQASGQSGLSSSTAHVATINPDGRFETETYLVSDGSTRRISFQVLVELTRGATLTSRLVLERIDLEGFLARVDAAEQRKPKSQTNLEFLASVRKVFQGGPNDPLASLFDKVLFRNRQVAPLFPVGSAEHDELKQFQTLYADGSFLDISHVLTGIEGSPAQKPDLGQAGYMVVDPQIVVTWGGDLGSALSGHAYRFVQALALDNAPDVQEELDRRASVPDLLGDIDGINVGASYDPAKTLKQNLLTYYGQMSRRRFHLFIGNYQTVNRTAAPLALQPNVRPPRITVQSRKTIAGHVRSFAAPMALMIYLSQLSGDQSNLVVSIFELDSPEMNLVVDYFAGFLERGLALEN